MKPEEQARADFEAWFEKRGVWPRLTFEEIWLAAYAQTRREALEYCASVARKEANAKGTAADVERAIRPLIKD